MDALISHKGSFVPFCLCAVATHCKARCFYVPGFDVLVVSDMKAAVTLRLHPEEIVKKKQKASPRLVYNVFCAIHISEIMNPC